MDAGSAPERIGELISRISCRTSRATLGLPGRRRNFQRPKVRNPARCQRTIVSGRTIVTASRTVGASRYSNQDKAIEGCEGRALGCAATQYIQLVAKRYYLSFERTPRSEEVQEDPAEQIERLSTRRSSPDSGAQTKWMGFAIGTRVLSLPSAAKRLRTVGPCAARLPQSGTGLRRAGFLHWHRRALITDWPGRGPPFKCRDLSRDSPRWSLCLPVAWAQLCEFCRAPQVRSRSKLRWTTHRSRCQYCDIGNQLEDVED